MECMDDFFKKVVRNPRSTGNVAAEWELGSEGRKGKMLYSKQCNRNLLKEKYELLKYYY